MKDDSINRHNWPQDPDRDPDHHQDLFDDPDDVMFAHTVAAPLRAPEQLRPGFEDRMLRALRAEQEAPPRAERRLHWWRRTIVLTPATLVAVAAGFACVVSLTTLALARIAINHTSLQQIAQGSLHPPTPEHIAGASESPSRSVQNAPSSNHDLHDTVYIVRFVFTDARAQQVSLVGDFNGWSKEVTPLRMASRPGVWSVDVALRPGRHEYAFVTDGKRWSPDPIADRVSDDFGTESSIVVVGGAWRSPSSSL